MIDIFVFIIKIGLLFLFLLLAVFILSISLALAGIILGWLSVFCNALASWIWVFCLLVLSKISYGLNYIFEIVKEICSIFLVVIKWISSKKYKTDIEPVLKESRIALSAENIEESKLVLKKIFAKYLFWEIVVFILGLLTIYIFKLESEIGVWSLLIVSFLFMKFIFYYPLSKSARKFFLILLLALFVLVPLVGWFLSKYY
jgi:hypothetical protein